MPSSRQVTVQTGVSPMAHRFASPSSSHTASRLGKIDAGLLMWIIALGVISLAFGLLALSRHGDWVNFREGNAEDPLHDPKDALQAILTHNAQRRAEIAALEKDIAQQEAHIRELDFELTGYGAYWSDQIQHNGWLSGRDDQETMWKTTEQVIAQRAARLQAWSDARRSPEAQRFDELDALVNQFQVNQQEVLTRAADAQARFETDREALILELIVLPLKVVRLIPNLISTRVPSKPKSSNLTQKFVSCLTSALSGLRKPKKFAEAQKVDLEKRYLILNKGLGDGVLPGLRFEMFTIDAGKYVVKGMVEVVEIDEHIAKCRIIEEVDPRHMPLHPGDMAGNPVFSPGDPKVFVFAGEFKRFNRGDLENFVRDLGAEVRPEIGPGVDFLIAGDRSEGVQDKAREYRLLAMYEDTLVRFLTTTFKPR